MKNAGVNRRPQKRQVFLGMDAMEWTLVQRWASTGALPTFRRLLAHGTCGELSSTSEQLPDTVWYSLCTGMNPAKLEKYFYVQYDPRTMGLRHVTDDAVHQLPFWQRLSNSGHRVAIFDVPKLTLSRQLNGAQIANWGAHATKTARASTPDSLMRELNANFTRYPVKDCDAVNTKPSSLKLLRDRIIEGVKLRGRVCRWLMHKCDWQTFIAVFSEPHCIGHHFWYGLDPANPRYGESEWAPLADSVERVYRAIDHELDAILKEAGTDTFALIFAAHGMGPMYHASWNIPEMLDLLGYGQSEEPRTATRQREGAVNPWRLLKMAVPGRLQYWIKSLLPPKVQDQLLFWWYAGNHDWKGCRAFAVPNNDSVGAIRISLKGRDKGGLVDPDDYKEVCSSIAHAFASLSDPVTGRPVVKRATITHEVFRGLFLDDLPDITVLWDQSFAWHSIHSPQFGTLRLRTQDARSGSHSPTGFFIATGPGVPENAVLQGHSIYDIAPTALANADVAIPSDLDGKVLALSNECQRAVL